MPQNYTTKTHDGHNLTRKENRFIDEYLKTGNIRQSVIKAGYQTKTPQVTGTNLLRKSYIVAEIEFREAQRTAECVADRAEILEYFTKVMRGKEKDAFGLDTPIGERTKAAVELAKRTIDIQDKMAGKNADSTIHVKLDWGEGE